jgi:UDP-N-acetylglucosamine--N-acetylmuramyl-(pentapeptide) pyrophosphoryl-undecaprenol N-acetylglucosamine transferase
MENGPIVIAAGGTGGHLFPAQALAQELVSRGHVVDLMTDERVNRFADDFPARTVHEIASATFGLAAPARIPGALAHLTVGYFQARRLLRRDRARAVVGFGGYPTLPPLLAARSLGLPTCVHEQNAVMGRVNRFLARRASVIAGSFDAPRHLPREAAARFTLTGNPVRPMVKALRASPFDAAAAAQGLRLLVFGGSQGARVMSDIVPEAVALLADRSGLAIVQQAREEDAERVRARYRELGVAAEVEPFFRDLPQRIADCHLVVGRAGASTISELAVIGRPGILVPLPHSLDQDQLENATRMAAAGGAWVMEQDGFTAQALADAIAGLQRAPERLAAAASAAAGFALADAETRLAELVERLISACAPAPV